MFPNQDIEHSGETETMINGEVDFVIFREQLNVVEICDVNEPEIESQ